MRKWWNWQTHHLEGVAPKGVGVQVPPSAPFTRPVHSRLLKAKEQHSMARLSCPKEAQAAKFVTGHHAALGPLWMAKVLN